MLYKVILIRLYLICVKTTTLKSNKLMTIQTKCNSCKKLQVFRNQTFILKVILKVFQNRSKPLAK